MIIKHRTDTTLKPQKSIHAYRYDSFFDTYKLGKVKKILLLTIHALPPPFSPFAVLGIEQALYHWATSTIPLPALFILTVSHWIAQSVPDLGIRLPQSLE